MNSNDRHRSSNLVVFASCVAIAILIWLASNFSETYNREYLFPIEYVNLPQELTVSSNISELRVSLQASGWQLLVNNIKSKKIQVNLSSKEEGIVRIFSQDLVTEMLPKSTIIKVVPDSYNIELNALNGKMVPIVVNYETDLSPNHYLTSELIAFPDSVYVVGAQDVLDTIESISTALIVVEGKDSFQQEVSLLPLKNGLLSLNAITVSGKMEEFTELRYELSVEAFGAPENLDFVMYPDKSTVAFLVPFSEYDNVVESNFKLGIEFSESAADASGEQKLLLKTQPSFIKNVQITPEVVNLVIYK